MNSKTSSSNPASPSTMSIYQMAVIAFMSALMCILGPLAIPIGPVPISLTNFVVFLAVYLLGTKSGTISYCIYLLIGLAGLPVFSGYSGGLAKLAGPTGGYLIGFIFTTVITGIFIQKSHGKTWIAICGMIIAMLVAYLFGTIWFVIEADCTLWYALTVCVFPFLIGDAIKIILSSKIGPMLYSALHKARLLESPGRKD